MALLIQKPCCTQFMHCNYLPMDIPNFPQPQEDCQYFSIDGSAEKTAVSTCKPLPMPALACLAACFAAAERIEEAKKTVQELLRFIPGFSIARCRTFLFFNESDVRRLGDYLRRAGLPE